MDTEETQLRIHVMEESVSEVEFVWNLVSFRPSRLYVVEVSVRSGSTVFALTSDWFTVLFACVVIGQSNLFGFGSKTIS